MATDIDPIEGYWYYDRDKDRRFEIIIADETEDRIVIQDYDGDRDEITYDYWATLDLDVATPPEEWAGPMDSLEEDDLDTNDQTLGPENRPSAMDRYRREQVEWAGKAHSPDPRLGERRRRPRSTR